MFPIGRYLSLPTDSDFPESPDEMSVGYIFNNPECGDEAETHTVRNWFRDFNIPLKDDYQLIQYLIPVPVSLRPLFDYVLTGKIQHLFQCRIAWEYAFCFRDFPILTV